MLDGFFIDELNTGNNPAATSAAVTAYKLQTMLRHANMSVFDYNLKEDTIWVRKSDMLLHDFTDYWFEDQGEFWVLRNVKKRIYDLIRASFCEHAEEMLHKIEHNLSGELLTLEVPLVYKGGKTRWTNFVMDTLPDRDGVPVYVIGYCKDIHAEKKELFRLRKMAQTDMLTGFRNKTFGKFRVEQAFVEQKEEHFVLAVMDLDKFKSANDLFGHAFGDTILQNVSARIQEAADREMLICRIGGDEFLLFRKCDDIDMAVRLLNDIKNALQYTVTNEKGTFDVNGSIGFAMYPTDGTTYEELFERADAAMYYAKKNKIRVPVFYEEKMSKFLQEDQK